MDRKPGEILRAEKALLEAEVHKLIADFEKETGVTVKALIPYRCTSVGAGIPSEEASVVYVRIKLEI